MNTDRLSLSNYDKLNLISNLSTMINAGIPILEAIDSLSEESKGNTKKTLETVREDLMQGKRLYTSLAKFPNIFDRVTVNIIRASEEGGTLDITLKDLKEQIKKNIEFSDKIKSAVAYPFLIIIIFFIVLLLILIVVIPKIAVVFSRLNVVLPLPTIILIFLSNTLLKYYIPIIIFIALFLVGIVYFYRLKRQWVLGVLYRLPLIRNLVKEIDLSYFSRSMYLLLSSGITITTALELSEDVVKRRDIHQAIAFAKEKVLSGKELSEAFKEQRKIFTTIMIKIIQVGEKTGSLEKSMQDISEHQSYQVDNTLKTLTTILEPLLLVVVGLLVGGMMLSILAPIYSIIGQVGGK